MGFPSPVTNVRGESVSSLAPPPAPAICGKRVGISFRVAIPWTPALMSGSWGAPGRGW
jgi:hypothetical protein